MERSDIASLKGCPKGGRGGGQQTFIKLLDPDTKGKSKQSHFWVIRRPPQPNGEGGGVLFHFDPGRNHEVALELLGDYRGALQCDGYNAYPVIDRKTGRVTLFFCWAHVRRKFVESLEFGGPAAAWYVAEIQRLYRVETRARESGLDASGRERLREELSRPVLKRIKERLDRDRAAELFLPSSSLGRAINYTLERWAGLERYTESGWGHIEIDNNGVENAICFSRRLTAPSPYGQPLAGCLRPHRGLRLPDGHRQEKLALHRSPQGGAALGNPLHDH